MISLPKPNCLRLLSHIPIHNYPYLSTLYTFQLQRHILLLKFGIWAKLFLDFYHPNLIVHIHSRHPEHEKLWLPYFEEKLEERGELNLYYNIETAFIELRNELLGISKESDIIKCECMEKMDSSMCLGISKDNATIPTTYCCKVYEELNITKDNVTRKDKLENSEVPHELTSNSDIINSGILRMHKN